MEYTPLFDNHCEIRMKNRKTVEAYCTCKDDDRQDRWMLYAEKRDPVQRDGFLTAEGFLDPGPFAGTSCSLAKKRSDEMENLRCFPVWNFYNNIYFENENDPNWMIVEGDGSGYSYRDPAHPLPHKDHYFNVFRLKDGQITSYVELRNATREFREEGRDLKYPNIEKFEAMYEIVAEDDDWDEPFAPMANDDPALREKNTETVRRFLGLCGKDCAKRWELFTEDCTAGPGYSLDGKVRRILGREALKTAEALRAECFPDWRFVENEFHYTSDPNYILVTNYGQGVCVGYGETPFVFREYMYHTFVMENGKIKSYREYYEPQKFAILTGFDMNLPVFGPPPGADTM